MLITQITSIIINEKFLKGTENGESKTCIIYIYYYVLIPLSKFFQ